MIRHEFKFSGKPTKNLGLGLRPKASFKGDYHD